MQLKVRKGIKCFFIQLFDDGCVKIIDRIFRYFFKYFKT